MTDVEDKVRKLLALASHPNTPVDEARTSAHQAAKLMREHGIDIASVLPGGAPTDSAASIGFAKHEALGFFMDLVSSLLHAAAKTAPAPQPAPPPPAPTHDPMMDPEFWKRWEEYSKRPRKQRLKRNAGKPRKKNVRRRRR